LRELLEKGGLFLKGGLDQFLFFLEKGLTGFEKALLDFGTIFDILVFLFVDFL
jgi:hypothetical protein